jgi:hypothetical protein
MNKAELQKRKTAMAARAKAEIAKSGIVQFRFEPANILKLYEASAKCKKPVGTMVREWVLERLQQEHGGAGGDKIQNIEKRLTALESKMRTTSADKRVRA